MKYLRFKIPVYYVLIATILVSIICDVVHRFEIIKIKTRFEEKLKMARKLTYADAIIDIKTHKKAFASLDDFDCDVMKQAYFKLIDIDKYYYFSFENSQLKKSTGSFERAFEIRQR